MAYDKRKSDSQAGLVPKRIKTEHSATSTQKPQRIENGPQNGGKAEDGKQTFLNGKHTFGPN